MQTETIYRRKPEINTPPTSPEELCPRNDKENRTTNTLYLYTITQNNP
jgi:hypothetical protein